METERRPPECGTAVVPEQQLPGILQEFPAFVTVGNIAPAEDHLRRGGKQLMITGVSPRRISEELKVCDQIFAEPYDTGVTVRFEQHFRERLPVHDELAQLLMEFGYGGYTQACGCIISFLKQDVVPYLRSGSG